MRLIYGTGNKAKLDFMKGMLKPLPLEIVGLSAVLDVLPKVDESGSDPLENAVLKASAYYKAVRAPVFSCDSGLFIEGVDTSLQPGVHVRTVNGRRMTDDEMLEYYASIAKGQGGFCRARYRNAICLIYDDEHIYKYAGDDISGESFFITSVPHSKSREGFPLDRLSVHIASGKYYFDLSEEPTFDMAQGFQSFFKGFLAGVKSL